MSQRAPTNRPIPPTPGNAEEYVSVPGAPYSPPRSRSSVPISLLRNGRNPPRPHQHTRSDSVQMQPKPSSPSSRNQTAEDVQMHTIGGGFGPYAVCCNYRQTRPRTAILLIPSLYALPRTQLSIYLAPRSKLSRLLVATRQWLLSKRARP